MRTGWPEGDYKLSPKGEKLHENFFGPHRGHRTSKRDRARYVVLDSFYSGAWDSKSLKDHDGLRSQHTYISEKELRNAYVYLIRNGFLVLGESSPKGSGSDRRYWVEFPSCGEIVKPVDSLFTGKEALEYIKELEEENPTRARNASIKRLSDKEVFVERELDMERIKNKEDEDWFEKGWDEAKREVMEEI